MICPHCKAEDNEVIKTIKYDTVIIRVRVCKKCQMPWQTHEIIPLQAVQTRDIPAKKSDKAM